MIPELTNAQRDLLMRIPDDWGPWPPRFDMGVFRAINRKGLIETEPGGNGGIRKSVLGLAVFGRARPPEPPPDPAKARAESLARRASPGGVRLGREVERDEDGEPIEDDGLTPG